MADPKNDVEIKPQDMHATGGTVKPLDMHATVGAATTDDMHATSEPAK